MISIDNNRIVRRAAGETLVVEPWGQDGIRVRSTLAAGLLELPGALTEEVAPEEANARMEGSGAVLENGKLRAIVSYEGQISFERIADGELLLREKGPMLKGPLCHFPGRHYKQLAGDHYELRLEFLPNEGERVYGLGQHNHGFLDQMGTSIDLYHHNTEFVIPFAVSSRKYGFLWNHPGVGRLELSRNRTVWSAASGRQIDYWVTAGDSYAELLQRYAEATGKSPMMPEWAAGYWQCKLRYKTQEELLNVAREHKRRGLPMDVIIIDFFHWTEMGDWKFDPEHWPDPQAMVRELEDMGIRTMVSVWPTVSTYSENYGEMERRGLLVRNESGVPNLQRYMMKGIADEHANSGDDHHAVRDYVGFYDSTHPEARKLLWEKLKENYVRYGIKLFWLDCNEPELKHVDYRNLRYDLGIGEEVTSLYPNCQAMAIQEGLQAEGEPDSAVTLSRSGWAGIQKYGTVLWSGDIESTFEEFKKQIAAGLNVSMSGVPWWNTDIGGFIIYDPEKGRDSEYFRELLIRWFQYGAFCPVFRMHGYRTPNEVWTYGEEAYHIFVKYLHLRERLKLYILRQMRMAHETGIPPMRPLFFDFESDPAAFEVSDQYLFGPDLLVAPVTKQGALERSVYLPKGCEWYDAWTGEKLAGGQTLRVEAPLDTIPVFVRDQGLLSIFTGDRRQ